MSSILTTSANKIFQFNVEIARELKDGNSAIVIDHLVNLSLPLSEKTFFTEEAIAKILTWASIREIKRVIKNLEQRKIFERLPNSGNLIVNVPNLKQFVSKVGGQER